MADSVKSGFLRTDVAGGSLGPLVVAGSVTAAAGSAAPVTGQVNDQAGVALTPKYAFANVAASATDSAIVAAVATKKIRVLGVVFVAGATATNLTFTSKPAGAGAAKSCLFANGANGGASLPFSPVGWFETVAGEGLSATTGAGSTTGIQVVYVEA